jgi:hypothetical protein
MFSEVLLMSLHDEPEDAPGGGARFCFTLPVAANIAEERELAADSHRR